MSSLGSVILYSHFLENHLKKLDSWEDPEHSSNAYIKKRFKEFQSGERKQFGDFFLDGESYFLGHEWAFLKQKKEVILSLLKEVPEVPLANKWKTGLDQMMKSLDAPRTALIDTKSGQISIPNAIRNVFHPRLDYVLQFEDNMINLIRSLSSEERHYIENLYQNPEEDIKKLFTCADEPPLSKGDHKFLNLCREWASNYKRSACKEPFQDCIKEGANLNILKNYLTSSEKKGLINALTASESAEEIIDLLQLGFPATWIPGKKYVSLCLEKLDDHILKEVIKKTHPHFLDLLSYDLSGDAEGILRQAISRKDCYQIGPKLVESALKFHNYTLLNVIFSSLSREQLETFSKLIVDELKSEEDPMIGAILIKHQPDFVKQYVSKEVLKSAVTEGRGWFVRWVLENGIALDQKEINALLPLALKTFNLEIIQSLYEYAEKKKLSVEVDFETFFNTNLPKEKEIQFDYLFGYFMNSSLSRAMKLIDFDPSLFVHVPRILELLSVITRFPEKYRNEIDYDRHITLDEEKPQSNVSAEKYISKSKEYAEANRKFIDSIVLNMPKTHKELLNSIATEKFSRVKNDPFYIDYVRDRFGPNNAFVGETPITGVVDRYNHSLRHFCEIAFGSNTGNKMSDYPSIKIENGDPVFHYTDRNGESKKLTTIRQFSFSMFWLHTASKTVEELQSEIELLHQQLLEKKDLSNPENKKLFNEKIARYYYLASTLCEKGRGTPHNAMMMLNIFYAYHKLQPPIPVLEHFFLDNTMLMLPIEVVIERWESFFEPTLETWVSAKLKQSPVVSEKLESKMDTL